MCALLNQNGLVRVLALAHSTSCIAPKNGQRSGPAIWLLQDGAEGANGNAENNGGRPKRKRKRDSHQQELNKQAQHRYRFATQSMSVSCCNHNNVLLYSLLHFTVVGLHKAVSLLRGFKPLQTLCSRP